MSPIFLSMKFYTTSAYIPAEIQEQFDDWWRANNFRSRGVAQRYAIRTAINESPRLTIPQRLHPSEYRFYSLVITADMLEAFDRWWQANLLPSRSKSLEAMYRYLLQEKK